ncbi:hypothetical protein B0H11DRAFT_1899070 [Mycena galericulata]|nr:hypothetical protein B0H11DRAFT_1899070 [Mycena galericulata]
MPGRPNRPNIKPNRPNTAFVRRGLLQTAEIGGLGDRPPAFECGFNASGSISNSFRSIMFPCHLKIGLACGFMIHVFSECPMSGVQSYLPAILENGQIKEAVTQCDLPSPRHLRAQNIHLTQRRAIIFSL